MLDRIANAPLRFRCSGHLYYQVRPRQLKGIGLMRAVVRCVLAVVGTAATVVAGPADVSLAAANKSYGLAIASVLPTRGEVVGVAHPVVVTLSAPVADRHAAERAIDVKSAPAITGKFEWLDNQV